MTIGRALALVLLLLMTFGASLSAHAHASLLRSNPPDGSVMEVAPVQFILTFNEPVRPTVFRLVDANGTGIDLRDIKADGPSITIGVPEIVAGTHALSWRVISADSHPVGGAIVFSVGKPTAAGIAVQSQTPLALAGLIWATRVLLYFGLFVGIGGGFFCAWIVAEPAHWPAGRLINAALLVGLLSAIFSLPLQGADALGAGLSSVGGWQNWAAGATSTLGLSLATGATAMLLAFVAGKSRNIVAARAFTIVALLGVGATLAVTGHASNAPPHWLTRTAVFLHSICVAFWIGALAPLGDSLRSGGARAAISLSRFSFLIPAPLALLLSAGFVLVAVQVEHLSALWTTTYGQILLLKLILVMVLALLGAWNRWRLADDVVVKRSNSKRSMLRLIAAEGALALAIFCLIASWRFTPPAGPGRDCRSGSTRAHSYPQ
jgi:copper transport protein